MEDERPVENPNELPMSFEEAKTVLEEDRKTKKEIIDNVYPWWQTLKMPFFIMSAVTAVLCLAVVFLAFTLQDLVDDRAQDTDQNTCYDLFTNASSEAIARVRSTNAELDAVGWSAVVRAINDETFNKNTVDKIDLLVDRSSRALEEDLLRIQERDKWVDEGRPLPCPIEDPSIEEES